MIDPLSLTLFALAAAYLLRDELAKSNCETARETGNARTHSRELAIRLQREINGMRRQQALEVLHKAKLQYVEKSRVYWELKNKYGARLKTLHEDATLLKSQRRLFYSTGRHGEIAYLKEKIDELYSVIDQVNRAFKSYKDQVSNFNASVAEIKALIDTYKR